MSYTLTFLSIFHILRYLFTLLFLSLSDALANKTIIVTIAFSLFIITLCNYTLQLIISITYKTTNVKKVNTVHNRQLGHGPQVSMILISLLPWISVTPVTGMSC